MTTPARLDEDEIRMPNPLAELSDDARLEAVAAMLDRLFDIALRSPRCNTPEGPAHKAIVYASMLSAIDEAAHVVRVAMAVRASATCG